MTIITKRFCCLLLGLGIWFTPVPVGLVPQAWHLFAIFAAVIFSVIIGAMPIVLASVVGLVASIMSGNGLSAPHDRPLPEIFKERFGSIEIGNRGGITVKGVEPCAPIESA